MNKHKKTRIKKQKKKKIKRKRKKIDTSKQKLQSLILTISLNQIYLQINKNAIGNLEIQRSRPKMLQPNKIDLRMFCEKLHP